jgi:hypothetical protein
MVLISNTVRSVFTTITTNASRNVFGNIPTDIPMNLIGCAFPNYCMGVTPYNPSLPFDYSGNTVSIQLSTCQLNAIKQIHDMYSIMLSSRSYDKIPANYEQYMSLLAVLETIPFSDSTIKLLLTIVEKTLVGCMNIQTIYQNSMYNSLQILLLNNQIDDILNNKNTKNVIADKNNVSGQFTAQQTFKLSKFYSYYIYLYGMPEFGVGFDPVKLVFLKKSLELFDQSHIQVPEVLCVPDTSGACVVTTDISSAPILQVVYEIGYTTNLYEHLVDYTLKYPLGYFITSMIHFDASNIITSVQLGFPLNDNDCSYCSDCSSSNFSLIDGFGKVGSMPPIDSSMTCLLQIGISNEHLNVYHTLDAILAANTFTCNHCTRSFFHSDLSGNLDSAHIPIDLSAALFDLSGVWFHDSRFWSASGQRAESLQQLTQQVASLPNEFGAWDASGILNYMGVWDSSAVLNSWVIDLLAPSYYLRPVTVPTVCQYCVPLLLDTSFCMIECGSNICHDVSTNTIYDPSVSSMDLVNVGSVMVTWNDDTMDESLDPYGVLGFQGFLTNMENDSSMNSLAITDISFVYHAYKYILAQLACDISNTGFYTTDHGYYTYHLSHQSLIHQSFYRANRLFGGDLIHYYYQSYQTETNQFTIMDISGNIYHTKCYEDILS